MPEFYRILLKNDAFVLVDKVSGISSHPSPNDASPNVVDELARSGIKAAPVARLDNQASGLLLLSGSPVFINSVGTINKTYQALVLGHADESGTVDRPLVVKKFKTKIKVKQDAVTNFETVRTVGPSASLLKIQIDTGRHHQIRRHLRSLGHPVIGDFRHGYADKNLLLQNQYGKKIRLFLHCSDISFHWKNKEKNFHSELPPDFQQFMVFMEKTQIQEIS